MIVPQLLLNAKAVLGEGPIWDVASQRLYWLDIEQGLVHVHDPNGESDQVFEIGCRVGALAVTNDDRFLLATERGFEFFDPASPESGPTLVATPESDLPANRFNDGKCDPRGRFVAGTMSMKKTVGAGSVYSFEPSYKSGEYAARRLFGDVTTSNGQAWSLSGDTMYYIDTPTLEVDALDYDLDTGEVANRRTVITFPDGVGRPDGMTSDAEGMLWICHWEGGRVTRWDPSSGELLETITMPVRRVTSCCFGGPNLERLYITSARVGLSETDLLDQPLAGGLFVCEPGVRGRPMPRFAE